MKKTTNKVIIVDGNNLAHRAYHSHKGLSYKGKSVAVIFGVIQILKSTIAQHRPSKVIVVWDGGRNARRKELCPEYKAGRKREDFSYEDFLRQLKACRKMLNYLGIPQVHHKSMEADDFIYMLTRKYKKENEVLLLSNDKDFFQLLDTNVSQILEKKHGQEVLTPDLFLLEFGFKNTQHADFLILCGDSSDNIKGYPQVGEVKAKQFLNTHKSIKTYIKTGKTDKVDISKLLPIWKVNREMIDLKYFYKQNLQGKIDITYLFKEKPKVRVEKYLELCNKYNFKLFAKPVNYEIFLLHGKK